MVDQPDSLAEFHMSADGSLQAGSQVRIIKAEQLRYYRKAHELTDEANRYAQSIDTKAQQIFAQAREQGYSEGLAEAQAERLKQDLKIERERAASLMATQNELTTLIGSLVRQIIGEIPSEARIGALAERALRELGTRQRVKVVVSPQRVESVRNRLEPIGATMDSTIEVVADPGLNSDTCQLLTVSGTLEADLAQQLAALEAALGENLVKTTEPGDVH